MKRKNKYKFIVVSLILLAPFFTGVKANTTENNEAIQDHNPILFLHGYTGEGSMVWHTMKKWFQDDEWPKTFLYAYDFDDKLNCSLQAIINNANKIKQWVDEILNETGAEKIDLVGHSMGGMSSRYYIKFLEGINTVDDYVSLGSPHHGNPNFHCGREGVKAVALILNEGDETPGGVLNDTLGIRYDPIWIEENITYKGAHVPGKINYTSIYSPDDGLCPDISSQLDGAHNISIPKVSHDNLIEDWSVYKYVRTAVNDLKGIIFRSTPLQTTSMTTTSGTPLTLIPVVVTMSLMALIVSHQRKPRTIIKIKRNRK
ncbi:MAG: esterase/lipase family protein [Candidatus Hodarchaeales archaeon]|jgi:triacylglycerol lipase